MDVTRMTRLAQWNLYTLAENYPEYMDRYSITMERLKMVSQVHLRAAWQEACVPGLDSSVPGLGRSPREGKGHPLQCP